MRTSPNPITRTLAATLIAASLAVAATAAHAWKPASYDPPSLPYLRSNLVQVDVYNRSTGAPLPIYPNSGRNWVEGVPGQEYAVRIRNLTGARVLVVTSVDGVNVISGDTASPSQSGYVLEPYGSVEIAGWRKSMSRTAAFYFTDLGDSYAARTGRPGNVGVIGVAVFQEKAREKIAGGIWDWRGRLAQRKDEGASRPAPTAAAEAESRAADTARAVERAETGTAGEASDDVGRASGSLPAPAAPPPPAAQPAPIVPSAKQSAESVPGADRGAAHSDFQRRQPLEAAERMAKLGTGHGRNEESRVTMTSFDRATSYPAETLTLQYDRRENLMAMGVLPRPTPHIARRDPNPFPGLRFAPDPR